jgi:hypothetical protein
MFMRFQEQPLRSRSEAQRLTRRWNMALSATALLALCFALSSNWQGTAACALVWIVGILLQIAENREQRLLVKNG